MMDVRLKKLQRILAHAISGMSAEEMNWHPPGKWCAAEVLEHLYLTYARTIRGFERITTAGKPLATTATLAQRCRSLIVVGLGYFPEGRKAPPVTQPKGLPPKQVLSGMIPAIQQMDEMITRSESALGRRTKLLDHPILGPLTATQWRKFHLVHGQHHARQLQRLRAACRARAA